MRSFTITNRVSGLILGDYEAASPADALEVLALDAGYAGYQEMCDAMPEGDDALIVEPMKCQCGKITGERCDHELEPGHIIEIEHMPEWLRASHEAAGGAALSCYPFNFAIAGAQRLFVTRECTAASELLDEWTVVHREF